MACVFFTKRLSANAVMIQKRVHGSFALLLALAGLVAAQEHTCTAKLAAFTAGFRSYRGFHLGMTRECKDPRTSSGFRAHRWSRRFQSRYQSGLRSAPGQAPHSQMSELFLSIFLTGA